MRFSMLTKKYSLACAGVILIILGATSPLPAQRQPVRPIVRFGLNGAYFGIEMEDVTADNMSKYKLTSETGVIVRSVEKGSPAEAAHLQEGDVILEYAGLPVFSSSALARMVQETPVNRTVSLTVSRDGKKLNLTVKLGERAGAPVPGAGFEVITPDNIRRFDFGRGLFFSVPRNGRSLLRSAPARPQLGVTIESLTDQMASFLGVPGKKGVLVMSVTAGSPAASTLKAGDVIVAMDGKPVAEPNDLTQALAGKIAGSKIELKVVRERKEISVSIEFPKATPVERGIIL